MFKRFPHAKTSTKVLYVLTVFMTVVQAYLMIIDPSVDNLVWLAVGGCAWAAMDWVGREEHKLWVKANEEPTHKISDYWFK